MKSFRILGDEIDYKELLQLDGALSVAHKSYNTSTIFSEIDCYNPCSDNQYDKIALGDDTEKILTKLFSFNGTENNDNKDYRVEAWKAYWEEYINAFDILSISLPNSVVTAYIGRHAIELGFKYIILKQTNEIALTHSLKDLSVLFFKKCAASDSYLSDIISFCELYEEYLEGSKVEYFRFPEYKNSLLFSGNHLDISWLSYNMALVLLKLTHYSESQKK